MKDYSFSTLYIKNYWSNINNFAWNLKDSDLLTLMKTKIQCLLKNFKKCKVYLEVMLLIDFKIILLNCMKIQDKVLNLS